MTEIGRRLSIDEAAQLIYQTQHPTEVQLDKVRHKLLRGVLWGSGRGNWITSESVAAYMAARVVADRLTAEEKKNLGTGKTDGTPGQRPSALNNRRQFRELQRIYRSALRDYFAAVINRRRPEHASAAFDRGVLIGQITLVVVPIVFAVIGYSRMTAPPPEQAIAEQWIEKNHGDFQVVEWFPPHPRPQGAGSSIRVRYRYFTRSRKRILTDQTLIVQDGQATLAATPDD